MLGWEEIKIKFTVGTYDYNIIDGGSGWQLVLRNADRDGGGFIVQRWDHEPNEEEINSTIFAVEQGIAFITSHLNTKNPPRLVEVLMPNIRVKVIDD